VVPANAVRDLVREVNRDEGTQFEEIASRTGARYLVVGSYSVSAGHLRFDVDLVDTESGELLPAPDPVSGPVDSLAAVIALLSDRVTAATVALLSPNSQPWATLGSSPPSMEVVRALFATSDLFCRAQLEEVIDQAQAVFEVAPDYGPLLSMLLYAYGNLGRQREWDSVYALLQPQMDQLTTTERLWVEWAHGIYHGDRIEATRAVEELYRILPGMAGYHAGITALDANRFTDAIERLLAHDRDAPCFRTWFPWWAQTAQAYHVLGRYEDELGIARDARERFPHIWMFFYYEAAALAGLGQLDAVDSLLDVIDGLPVQPGYSPGQQMTFIAIELKALGLQDAYESVMERSSAWFAARPASELRHARGWAFYYGEHWSDADTLYTSLSAEAPDNVDYRGYRAVALAHLGRREEALEIDEWLRSRTSSFLQGNHTRWRAAIAAALGDRAGAVQLLQQAYQEGMNLGWSHNRDPEWETLRDYRPYLELMGPEWPDRGR
jgi:tetratricopeptide (TPR) repeat protein